MTRVCVVGAGTIGGLLAAHLSRVADVSVLTRRPEHADALLKHGLKVSGRSVFTARVNASYDPERIDEPDIVVLACKGVDLDEAAASIAGRFKTASVATIQNGLGAEEAIRAHGNWRLISGFTFMSGTRLSDTHVEYVLEAPTWLGPYRGTSFSQVEALAALFVGAGLKVVARKDIAPSRWAKLIFNATVNAVAALTGLPHNEHFAREGTLSDLGHLVRGLMSEGCAVARAAGVTLDDDPWEMNRFASARGAHHYPSMLEDVLAGRPTEVELINGSLLRAADSVGVDAPLHKAIYSLVKAKEAAEGVRQGQRRAG